MSSPLPSSLASYINSQRRLIFKSMTSQSLRPTAKNSPPQNPRDIILHKNLRPPPPTSHLRNPLSKISPLKNFCVLALPILRTPLPQNQTLRHSRLDYLSRHFYPDFGLELHRKICPFFIHQKSPKNTLKFLPKITIKTSHQKREFFLLEKHPDTVTIPILCQGDKSFVFR